MSEAKTAILNNKTALGIEFGSTRIKAVLVDDKYNPIASGSYEWENRYENGVWTYSLDDIRNGLQGSYSDLVKDVQEKYGVELTSVGALGISAMMHGYMPFDKDGKLLVPFRTWRNNITGEASEKLTGAFPVQYPAEMEHRTSVSGDPERRRPCEGYRLYVPHWKLTYTVC